MSYLVFCTFDLKNASSQDYKNAYDDLERIGLKKVAASKDGTKVVIPTTAAIGKFDGTNSTSVRDHVQRQIENAFKARRLKSEIFIVAGDNWAWGSGTT